MDFPHKLLTVGRRPAVAAAARFLSLPDLLSKSQSKKIVWFGEFHSEERICSFLHTLLAGMHGHGHLHVVAEHFSFEMDDLLRRFQSSSLTFENFVDEYRKIGTEGHDLGHYRHMMEHCRQNAEGITLHGGFIPRPYASAYMKAGSVEEKIDLYKKLSCEMGYLPDLASLQSVDAHLGLDRERLPPLPSDDRDKLSRPVELYGCPGHYNLFESLMSGRDIYDIDGDCPPPGDSFQRIFQAQLVKDWAMAWRLKSLVESCSPEDKFLVIAGRAHLSHHHGVPEIYSWLCKADQNADQPHKVEDELLICAQMMYECDLDERIDKENDEVAERTILSSDIIRGSMLGEGSGGTFARPVADVLYIYDEEDWSGDSNSDQDQNSDGNASWGGSVSPNSRLNDIYDGNKEKKETVEAYDKVGSTAGARGNEKKARAILTFLGYSPEEQNAIGDDDIYNFQGVGNPFPLGKIQQGERVIDLGCGLGTDSFLAAHYTGPDGEVLGVDISKKEIKHASSRATERGLSQFVNFSHGDVEKLSTLSSNHFDVAISNGAFCLAPNKQRAFESVYRVLKKGGRMSICTTTTRKDLDVETQWPVCMRMFIHIDRLKPMCEAIGFKNVVVDTTDSDLEFELEGITEEEFNEANEERSKIHVGGDQYRHLEGYDMNDLCSRVVVYGEK